MILRPIRTLLVVGLAFIAGVLYERFQQGEACADQGGRINNGLCLGDVK